jgi:hypothetical protein
VKVPTDLKILNKIYTMYYEEFSSFTRGQENGRQTKIYVPINCSDIARALGVDNDIVFGRLYYHLNSLYSYKHEDGTKVSFFAKKIGNDEKCIHFPLLASVLAGLQEDNKKFNYTLWLSVVAIVVSSIALGISTLEYFSIGTTAP